MILFYPCYSNDSFYLGLLDLVVLSVQKLPGKIPIIYLLFMFVVAGIAFAFLYYEYSFVVSCPIVWFLFHLLIQVVFVVIFLAKRDTITKAAFGVTQLLPLCSLPYIFAVGELIDGVPGILLMLHVLFCFLSCFIMSVASKGPLIFQTIIAAVNGIILCFFLILSLLQMTFGQIGQRTVVKEVVSPNASYTAVLIEYDQGALGGNIIVDIEYNQYEIDIGLGRFVKKRRLYTGGWGNASNMKLQGEDDSVLLIGDRSYDMEEEQT